jgi:hypothetical protein
MPTYDVTWVEWTTWSAEVEADTPEDAERIPFGGRGTVDERFVQEDSIEVIAHDEEEEE